METSFLTVQFDEDLNSLSNSFKRRNVDDVGLSMSVEFMPLILPNSVRRWYLFTITKYKGNTRRIRFIKWIMHRSFRQRATWILVTSRPKVGSRWKLLRRSVKQFRPTRRREILRSFVRVLRVRGSKSGQCNTRLPLSSDS